ncbi:hypothetical protein ACFSTC_33295 [Nonomuraea ferruginea]
MRVLAVVPARGGSAGVPLKNLAPRRGHPARGSRGPRVPAGRAGGRGGGEHRSPGHRRGRRAGGRAGGGAAEPS